jgi:hypothetical protein
VEQLGVQVVQSGTQGSGGTVRCANGTAMVQVLQVLHSGVQVR